MSGFVYNEPTPIDNESKGVLEVTFGLFFDGTLNNRRNTEIRKKVKGLDHYGNPTQEELDIYKKEAYERTSKSFWTEKEEKGDDSFSNDFTNVARMSLCCNERKYAIYIEGIGTEDEESDYRQGYVFGTGQTGIRMKVRKGCELLAERIKEKKKEFEEGGTHIKTIRLDIDAFGFSRGAAAARNFIYEIQKRAYKPLSNILATDSFGKTIKNEWLDNRGYLPPLGHLGVALLELDFSLEELKRIRVQPRFMGLYDTVSSKNVMPYFPETTGNDVEELQLNNLGRVRKAVHFTAQDEHRENFALTRLPGSIEKNLPGVHSDIGGSYVNGLEKIKCIEDNGGHISYEELIHYYVKLIKDYWFKPSQISINLDPTFWINPIVPLVPHMQIDISSERDLKKEYSYIHLHFMKDHAETFIKDYIIKNVEETYSIENDNVLVQTKKHLKKYVMEDGEQWTFVSDEELKKTKKLNALKEETKEQLEERAFKEHIESMKTVMIDNTRVATPKIQVLQKELEQLVAKEKNEKDLTAKVVDPTYSEQELIRKLRNEYLHWSARREGIGMDPVTSRKRIEY